STMPTASRSTPADARRVVTTGTAMGDAIRQPRQSLSAPLPACGERSTREARRGRGRCRRAELGRFGERFAKLRPAATPPHPDPLPASGEREFAETAERSSIHRQYVWAPRTGAQRLSI